jgi:hypothetical protein
MLSDWSLCTWRFLTNPRGIVLRILSWNHLVRKDMNCGNIIPSVCKVEKSIRDEKDVSYLKRQVYKNLWLEVAKQIEVI